MNKSSGFDGRIVVAIVFTVILWVLYQAYLQKKYPDAFKAAPVPEQTASVEAEAPAAERRAGTPEVSTIAEVSNQEKLTDYEDDVWSFQISSVGMGLKNVRLKEYSDRDQRPIVFGENPANALFATGLIGRRSPVAFDVKTTAPGEFLGIASVDGMKITKIIHVDSERYIVNVKIRVENSSDQFAGLVTTFENPLESYEGGFFLLPQFEHQEFFVSHDGTTSRSMVSPKDALSENYPKTHIAGFGSQYFAVAVIDKSDILPEFRAITLTGSNPTGSGVLSYSFPQRNSDINVDFTAFAGPKSYELLKTIDADLTNLINFGFFTSIAKGIFWLMTKLHAALGNWGLAIIFLTLLVRMIVLPFNVMSYRQMKAMAKVQPQIKSLREKYKDQPQKANEEILRVMKEAKANPLGGCLPMLLQIPIFFALYQVIGQSIELYKAPFMLWIQDLSVKDPFFVLPILMGATMYIQQKITPSTLEPAQQKVLAFMPIFFSLLMLSLPSGLTLYIFISSVFGVVQQIYFMKEKTEAAAA